MPDDEVPEIPEVPVPFKPARPPTGRGLANDVWSQPVPAPAKEAKARKEEIDSWPTWMLGEKPPVERGPDPCGRQPIGVLPRSWITCEHIAGRGKADMEGWGSRGGKKAVTEGRMGAAAAASSTPAQPESTEKAGPGAVEEADEGEEQDEDKPSPKVRPPACFLRWILYLDTCLASVWVVKAGARDGYQFDATNYSSDESDSESEAPARRRSLEVFTGRAESSQCSYTFRRNTDSLVHNELFASVYTVNAQLQVQSTTSTCLLWVSPG